VPQFWIDWGHQNCLNFGFEFGQKTYPIWKSLGNKFAPVWMIWAIDLPQFELVGVSNMPQFWIDWCIRCALVLNWLGHQTCPSFWIGMGYVMRCEMIWYACIVMTWKWWCDWTIQCMKWLTMVDNGFLEMICLSYMICLCNDIIWYAKKYNDGFFCLMPWYAWMATMTNHTLCHDEWWFVRSLKLQLWENY